MHRNYSRRHSREEMAMIVAEYQTGTLSRKEIAEKYGINSPSCISNWIKRLQNPRKSLPLHLKTTENITNIRQDTSAKDMEKKDYSCLDEELKALREELARTKSQLEWEKKRSLAYETLIRIAEEHGMPVKKYGAKQ